MSYSSDMEGFEEICELSDLKKNGGRRFLINDVDVAVFYVNDEVFAVSNVCPHQHSATLFDGFIENLNVVCPAHGWEFDLKTGKQPDGRKGIRTFPVKVVDKKVYVKAEKQEQNWKW